MEDRNPCRQFKRAKERPKKRKFTNAELARLERALLSLVSEGQLDEVVADLVRFLAFSAQRIGEAINLTWDSIDERRNLMGVDNHKTDDGGTVEKILPLNTHLKAVLKRRKAVMQGPLVFPSSVTGGPIKGIPKCWSRILERANIGLHKGERATPHDFRRTFRSHCGELGYPDSVGETFLGHGLGKVQGTYLHYGPHGLLGKAYQATADMIAAAMAGKNPKPGVPIQKKGNKKPSPAKSLPPEKA
jgi:integrase